MILSHRTTGALAVIGLVAAALGTNRSLAADTLVLSLRNGDSVSGSVAPAAKQNDSARRFAWASSLFLDPLEFPLSAVRSIGSAGVQPKRSREEFGFELANGDWVQGRVIRWADAELTLQSETLGRVVLPTSSVRMLRRQAAEETGAYIGPNGLDGWKIVRGDEKSWQSNGSTFSTSSTGTAVFRDIGFPARASVDLELSWRNTPDFVVAFGSQADERATRHAFRLEVSDGRIIAIRETDREADVAPVSPEAIPSGAGQISLRLQIDQTTGRMAAFDWNGTKLAELQAHAKTGATQSGLWIENWNGDLRVDRIRVLPWNAADLDAKSADRVAVQCNDSKWLAASLDALRIVEGEVVLEVDGKRTTRPLESIVAMQFPGAMQRASANAVRANYADGTQVTGSIVELSAESIRLSQPETKLTHSLPWDGLARLEFAEAKDDEPAKPAAMRGDVGELRAAGVRLTGSLGESPRSEDGVPIPWQAASALGPARLALNANARIVYRETKTVAAAPPPQAHKQVQQGGFLGGLVQLLGANPNAAGKARTHSVSAEKPVLHLLTGDTLPCRIESIDERGVTIESPIAAVSLIEHRHVKAIELAVLPAQTISKIKQERLLTLPRMQRDNPPTFLVRSVDGDYLRGRDMRLTAESGSLTMRFEPRTVARNRIARIIWLHPETSQPKPDDASPSPEPARRVQAVRSDGTRITFQPLAIAAGKFDGVSDVLGDCSVSFDEIDELLIGGEIERTAQSLPFHQWQLAQAPDPRVFSSEDAGDESASPLVGKPAPEFELPLLDGKVQRLADLKGRIVVLDFWASWCGPCVRAMPIVESVVREYADRNVTLLAINLEEPAERIRPALERMRIDPAVALDRDGKVAGEYGATSIPQTVIIDRDGKVVRVFVGAGGDFDDQLRAALQAVVERK